MHFSVLYNRNGHFSGGYELKNKRKLAAPMCRPIFSIWMFFYRLFAC